MTKDQLLKHALALIALAKSEGDWIDDRWHCREERIAHYLTEHFLEKEEYEIGMRRLQDALGAIYRAIEDKYGSKEAFNLTYIATALEAGKEE